MIPKKYVKYIQKDVTASLGFIVSNGPFIALQVPAFCLDMQTQFHTVQYPILRHVQVSAVSTKVSHFPQQGLLRSPGGGAEPRSQHLDPAVALAHHRSQSFPRDTCRSHRSILASFHQGRSPSKGNSSLLTRSMRYPISLSCRVVTLSKTLLCMVHCGKVHDLVLVSVLVRV